MPRPTPWTVSPRGAVTWVTMLLLVIVIGGGYLVWTWAPVYVLHAEVKQVVRDYMNQAVRNQNDAVLIEAMLYKLRTLDQHMVVGEDGTPVAEPTVQVAAEDVTWERDGNAEPPTLHVAFQYTRVVPYPLVERWTEKTFAVDLTNDLVVPDWGPSR